MSAESAVTLAESREIDAEVRVPDNLEPLLSVTAIELEEWAAMSPVMDWAVKVPLFPSASPDML